MAWLTSDLAALAASRHGVLSPDDLSGASAHAIRELITTGVLVRVHHGAVRLRSSPDTFEARCAAACVADAESVISSTAAARLWEFRHCWRPDEPIVTVFHDRTPLTRGVRLRRTNVLPTSHVVHRDDGIRLTSPPRTWFDCAYELDDERFERLTEWVIDQHTSVPTLWAVVRVMSARGRRGLARVHRVMSARGDWQRPAGSGLELRVLKALEFAGVGPLVRQYPLRLGDGSIIHPDGADPSIRWAIEVDHVTWHGGRLDAQRDKSRDRRARAIGWQVDRVTDQELATDFDATIADLVDLYRLQRRDVA